MGLLDKAILTHIVSQHQLCCDRWPSADVKADD